MSGRVKPILVLLAIIHGTGWVIALCSRLSLNHGVPQYMFGVQISNSLADQLIGFELMALFPCGLALLVFAMFLLLLAAIRWAGQARSDRQGNEIC